MFGGYINKKAAMFMAATLIFGFAAGAGYSWASDGSGTGYDAKQLTEKLTYAKVEAGRLRCLVLTDGAAMYHAPSALSGRIIERMSKGVQVDYLDTVSSQDKDERYALTTEDIQIRRLFSRTRTVPAGSEVLVLRSDGGSGETRVRAMADGREYEINVEAVLLRFPYLGQWKKVEYQGKPGYMKYGELSDSKLM